MNNNFSLSIDSIADDPECYEYDVSFLDKKRVRWSEGGTCPSIEMCYDSAMNYYSEVMHGYIEEEPYDDVEDDFVSILADDMWD